MHADSNCVQVLAPSAEAAVAPANFLSGEQLCHVSRDVALVLSFFMDAPPMQSNDLNEYGVDFYFECVLLEDSNHRKDGFRIEIVVRTVNSNSWTEKFIEILNINKLKYVKHPKIKY